MYLHALGHADVGARVVVRAAVEVPPAEERRDGVVAGDGPVPVAGGPVGRDLGRPALLRLLQGLLRLRLLRGKLGGLLRKLTLRGGDLRQQRPGLGPLVLQLRQMGLQLALGLGLLVTAGLERLPGLSQRPLGGLQLRHDAVAVVHDVAHQHGIIQQLGETFGLKQHGENGRLSRLLHPAHLLIEFLHLGGLFGLQLRDLPLLLLNLRVVPGQNLPARADLLLGQKYLFLDQLHLLLGAAQVPPDGGKLLLRFLFPGRHAAELVFDGLDIALGHRPGGQHRGEQQRRRHKEGYHSLSRFHNRPQFPVTPGGTSGWQSWSPARR